METVQMSIIGSWLDKMWVECNVEYWATLAEEVTVCTLA